jgi:hypothetical protein
LVLLRPKAATRGLSGKLSYVSGGQRVSFEYDVMRLWKQPVQPFLEGGVGLLPLAALCEMPAGKPVGQAIREVVHEIDRRLAAMPDQAQAVRLMTAAFILTGMRVPKQRLSQIYEGVRIMHKTTAWDEAVDEGYRKGRAKSLLDVGRQRFGEPDPNIEDSLAAIQNVERVERMFDAVWRVKSWKALLSIK